MFSHQEANEFFTYLENFRKTYAKPYEEKVLALMQDKIRLLDATMFHVDDIAPADRDEQESLFNYYDRLIKCLEKLKSTLHKLEEYKNILSSLPNSFQLDINATNINAICNKLSHTQKILRFQFQETERKIKALKDSVKGCEFVYEPDETNLDKLEAEEGKLYLKQNGGYKTCYKGQIFNGNIVFKDGYQLDLKNEINDPVFKKLILRHTSAINYTAERDILAIKAEEEKKEIASMKLKPNTITLRIWHNTAPGKRRTLFGHDSNGHISVNVCDENGDSHYVSVYHSDTPEYSLISDLLNIPSMNSTKGRFDTNINDILRYVDNEFGHNKFVECQEIIFDCNKNHALDIKKSVLRADELLRDGIDFDFYSNNCSRVGLSVLLAAGANQFVSPPDAYVISPHDVMQYGMAVKNTLDSLDDKLNLNKKNIETLLQDLIKGSTNSDGVKQMQELGKNFNLENGRSIVGERDKGGFLGATFQYYYSHSSFFGKGRQKWVDQLYDFLRVVDVADDDENLVKLAKILETKESENRFERGTNSKVFKQYQFHR